MRHETAIFGPKKTQIQKFQIIFVIFFQQQKTQTCSETPHLYSVLAKSKKEIFQRLNSKHKNWKTEVLHPLFEKGNFLKIAW